ncbi:hypothetical protein ACFWMU_18445 [Streptomyces sp. NPDC058357]|uniref:hypothetical protein n=1 Tax=unclassified Streptomyces TaxID=2593676 RepID=UPI00364E4AD3
MAKPQVGNLGLLVLAALLSELPALGAGAGGPAGRSLSAVSGVAVRAGLGQRTGKPKE